MQQWTDEYLIEIMRRCAEELSARRPRWTDIPEAPLTISSNDPAGSIVDA